jgi:hypothetical protein
MMIQSDVRGPEGPLFHGDARIREFFRDLLNSRPSPLELVPFSFGTTYAALKGRSSTAMHAFVSFSATFLNSRPSPLELVPFSVGTTTRL